MTDKDIARNTGWIVKGMLEYCFNPEVGDPWKKDKRGYRIRMTKDEIREIDETIKDIPEKEFNNIIEGLKNSLFSTLHSEDQYAISLTGLV